MIGANAFNGCTGLESLTMPFLGSDRDGTQATNIGYIFDGSTTNSTTSLPSSLKTINITDATSIGNSAFSNCSNLTSITIPNSVTSIGQSAFKGCTSLESLTLPFVGSNRNGTPARNIGYIFNGSTSNLTNSLPTSLKNIVITDATSIGEGAFSNCSNLTTITIPNGVTSIGYEAFSYCRNLTTITIPNSVTSIGVNAFYCCKSLTTITLPNSVTSIADYVFAACTSLTTITIPNGVTSIGAYAIAGCSSLTTITIDGETLKTGTNSMFYNCTNLTDIYVKESLVDEYKAATYWSNYANLIKPIP